MMSVDNCPGDRLRAASCLRARSGQEVTRPKQLTAIIAIADRLSVGIVYALCHPDNPASIRVLEKCGFELRARLARHTVFQNLGIAEPQDCVRYERRKPLGGCECQLARPGNQ